MMLSGKHKKSDHLPLWRNLNYLLLQSGQLVSFIGDQQQFIALPLLVLALTGSVVQAGLVAGLGAITTIVVSPLAGVLVDRWDRKATMLICDGGRMLITFTIPLAFWLNVLTMPQLYIAVALAGMLGTIFSVANASALPQIVAPEQLPEALAQSQIAFTVVRVSGSLLGGALYSIGRVLPFLVNAVSFGASVLSLSFMRGKFQKDRDDGADRRPEPWYKAAAEGFAWLWRQPLLRFLVLVNGGDSLRYGAGYLVILVLAENLHASPSGIGAIFTAAAVGSLLGNALGSRVRKYLRFGTIAIAVLWVEALVFPFYAIAPNILWMCLIAASEELLGPIYAIPLSTYQLLATPDAMRGRVNSTLQLVMRGTSSLGAILSGIMIQALGAQWSAMILAAWLLLLAVVMTLNKRVRRAELETMK